MRFRIREGFKLFRTPDEALEFEAGNRAIVPRAQGGEIVALTSAELGSLQRQGSLGKLEPLDQEAIEFYGTTEPMTARAAVAPDPHRATAPHQTHRTPFNRGETIGPDELRSLARGML
jgi:hypothetical protein